MGFILAEDGGDLLDEAGNPLLDEAGNPAAGAPHPLVSPSQAAIQAASW